MTSPDVVLVGGLLALVGFFAARLGFFLVDAMAIRRGLADPVTIASLRTVVHDVTIFATVAVLLITFDPRVPIQALALVPLAVAAGVLCAVAIDVPLIGVVMSMRRWKTGSWTCPSAPMNDHEDHR